MEFCVCVVKKFLKRKDKKKILGKKETFSRFGTLYAILVI